MLYDKSMKKRSDIFSEERSNGLCADSRENGENMQKNGWPDEGELEKMQLEKSEYDRNHTSMEYEARISRIVREGDLEAMRALLDTDRFDSEKIGKIAVSDRKQMEYMVVVMIYILSRSAIDGGLNPQIAYGLSDVYLRRLERCGTAEEMGELGARAQLEFTRRVHDARLEKRGNSHVDQCKDFVFRNLHRPFAVGDIAPALGVTSPYLSKLFHKSEGITIQQYISKERCAHAANMLKYSDYPISVISEYFCFSSQSHFGRQFKKWYGCTPRAYRTACQSIDYEKVGDFTI